MRLSLKHGVGRYAFLIVGLGIAGVAIGWCRPGLAQDVSAIRSPGAR